MSNPKVVTVGTGAQELCDFGNHDGKVSAALYSDGLVKLGFSNGVVFSSGFPLIANAYFSVTPPPGVTKLYAIKDASTASVNVWLVGGGADAI
jgi:hypothetical protein